MCATRTTSNNLLLCLRFRHAHALCSSPLHGYACATTVVGCVQQTPTVLPYQRSLASVWYLRWCCFPESLPFAKTYIQKKKQGTPHEVFPSSPPAAHFFFLACDAMRYDTMRTCDCFRAGSIPVELTQPKNLVKIWLDDNDLDGGEYSTYMRGSFCSRVHELDGR